MAQLSVGQVIQLAQRGDEATRLNAVKALFSLGSPEAGQALRLMARDQADTVRRLAVQAYQQLEARLGGPGSIPAGVPPGAGGSISGPSPAVRGPPSGMHVAPPVPGAAAGPPSGMHPAAGGPPSQAMARPAAPPSGGDSGLAGLVGAGATSAVARQVQATPAGPPAPPAPAGAGGLAALVGGGATSAVARQVQAPLAAPRPTPGAGTPAPPLAAAAPPAAGEAASPLQNFQRALQGYADMRSRLEAAYESVLRLRDGALAQGVPEAHLPMPAPPGGGGADAPGVEAAPEAPGRLDPAHRQVLLAASQAAARGQRANPGDIQEAEVPALRRAGAALLAPCLERCLEGLTEPRSELAQTHARALGLLAPAGAFEALQACIQKQVMEPAFFEAIGLLGDPRGIGLLISVYAEDRFAGAKQFVVHAAARLPGDQSDQFLVRLLEDPDPSIRTAVVNHIGVCGRSHLLKPVLRGLGQSGDNIDVAIAKTAVILAPRDPGVLAALSERLATSDVESRLGKALIAALGKTGSPEALAFLQPYTKSRDRRLKQMAIDAVCELEISAEQKLKLLGPALRETNLKGEKDSKGRAQAAVQSVALGGTSGHETIAEMVRSQESEDRAWGAWALGETRHEQAQGLLRQLLKDHDLDVRIAAVRALGVLQNPAGVPLLAEVTKDKSDELRAAAVEALAQLGPAAHAAVAELVETEYRPSVLSPCLRALAMTDPAPPSTWPRLHEFLVNDEGQVRLAATEGAVRVMHDDAVPDLLERLGDAEHKIRQVAARGLWSYGDVRLVPRVLDLLASEDDEVRLGGALVVQALGELHRDIRELDDVGRLVLALRSQPQYRGTP